MSISSKKLEALEKKIKIAHDKAATFLWWYFETCPESRKPLCAAISKMYGRKYNRLVKKRDRITRRVNQNEYR